MDIVPFVSLEQYPTPVYKFTVLNISLQPIKERTLRNFWSVRRPWYLKKYCTCVICPIAFPYFQTD